MRLEGYATWDGGNSTWGGRVKGFGTVPVCVRAQEKLGKRGLFWQEKELRYGEAVPANGTLKKSILPPMWSVVTKGGSSKAPTGSKTGHLKRKKESSSAMDSNLSQTSASTLVVVEMHKEDHQATGGPTSLEVTSETRSNPQLSSGMSTFNLNEPIYSTSFIIHSESASRNDASAVSTAEADLGNSAPSDFVTQQQGMNKGTKNTSSDHLFLGTNPHVLVDQTISVSEGLEKPSSLNL
uniref:Uncharacterized protein n=1 Tax=Tanacetum cinerariifolium TaxID=118510 RepID=A0A6L2MGL3_TANCI|nr:hypothetical protein [Tanacetum cinerariifolium]